MGTRLILTSVLCAFWLAADAGTALAQPTILHATCSVQNAQAAGNPVVTWGISGGAALAGLPAGTTQITATFYIEKQLNGATTWDTVTHVRQISAITGGADSLNTGFFTLGAAPQQGERFRVRVKVHYQEDAAPRRSGILSLIESPPLVPLP